MSPALPLHRCPIVRRERTNCVLARGLFSSPRPQRGGGGKSRWSRRPVARSLRPDHHPGVGGHCVGIGYLERSPFRRSSGAARNSYGSEPDKNDHMRSGHGYMWTRAQQQARQRTRPLMEIKGPPNASHAPSVWRPGRTPAPEARLAQRRAGPAPPGARARPAVLRSGIGPGSGPGRTMAGALCLVIHGL